MLLSITTTHNPATDLGFLLHKHPGRAQSFELSHGIAHVFYPEASDARTTACLLLDVDPVGMVRGKNRQQPASLGQYVNDRPYVASSLMSVALSRVFGSAMAGRCEARPELAATPIPLVARIDVLPVRGDESLLPRLFEPLGYWVEGVRHPLDETFPKWGESPYHSVTITGTKTLAELLTHLYVLIPTFDDEKHYWVGEDELEKLLAKGDGWLSAHPEKEQITRRYLKHRSNLYRPALARLIEEEGDATGNDEETTEVAEDSLEKPLSLNEQRHGAVLAVLRVSGAKTVLDLGCGEGLLLRALLDERQFERIVGVDVSVRALGRAAQRLEYDRLPPKQRERIQLLHGSLIYRDQRLSGFDAAAVVEVIEHLDPPRLAAFERVLFEFARPKSIVLTTPNREFNVRWQSLPAGQFRHRDHRFEWSRAEFQDWAIRVAERFGYSVRFVPIGIEDPAVGPPTQVGVFEFD
ncbi:MAG TPA: 3' terminal RNA ribose 2'-O-methyltransferase Hen1 [Pirellulales bacterium]